MIKVDAIASMKDMPGTKAQVTEDVALKFRKVLLLETTLIGNPQNQIQNPILHQEGQHS